MGTGPQAASTTGNPTACTSPVFNSNSSDPSSTCSSASSSSSSNPPQATSTKQPSSWRLIFYPNGAGVDCKNFLSIFLKYLSDEPVKIQMMFSIVDNQNEEVYVKYTVNNFNNSNDWGFKQLIHKNAIIYQKEKFLKPYKGGSLVIRVKMRLDEHKNDYIKKLNENLHYCKLLSENFSQYYYNSSSGCCDLAPVESSSPSSSSIISNGAQNPSNSCLPSSSNSAAKTGETSRNSTLASLSTLSSVNNSYYDLVLLVKNSNTESADATSDRATVGQKRPLDSSPASPNKKFKAGVDNNSGQKTSSQIQLNESEEYIELRAHKCILAARSPVFKVNISDKIGLNYSLRKIMLF